MDDYSGDNEEEEELSDLDTDKRSCHSHLTESGTESGNESGSKSGHVAEGEDTSGNKMDGI